MPTSAWVRLVAVGTVVNRPKPSHQPPTSSTVSTTSPPAISAMRMRWLSTGAGRRGVPYALPPGAPAPPAPAE